MSDLSTHLKLPYLMPSQAQKHVTVNEALRALDLIVHLSVLDRDLSVPPSSPIDGDRYIIAAGATGAWAGQDDKIAAWVDGAWLFLAAKAGWTVWIADEAAYFVHDGSIWAGISGGTGFGTFTEIGIGGAASDATNRLAVQSPAVLLNHDGNGVQAKLNKAAAADTASVLFQTAFSGRAEFGLTGDDDWHVKVSADGTNWSEALVVDKVNGFTAFGGTPLRRLTVVEEGAASFIAAVGYGGDAIFEARRARGTEAAPTALLNHDVVLGLQARGHDGSGWNNINAQLTFRAAENLSPTGSGSYMRIQVTPNGTTTRVQAMKITDGGDIIIGTSGAAAAKLDVDGVVKLKSYTLATLPASVAGGMIYVSNETGGAVLAFGDGTNWRRVTDRAIVA